MGKHKSVEAKRLTRIGRALEEWSDVLYNDASVFDMMAGDAATARELAVMADTAENRELLADAAYRCGVSDIEAEWLSCWVYEELPDTSVGAGGFFAAQSEMRSILADYDGEVARLADEECDCDE